MVSRKINTDAIDENLLIASIGKSKIGTTTASILDGASQSQVKDPKRKKRLAGSPNARRPISRQFHASLPRLLRKVTIRHSSSETR